MHPCEGRLRERATPAKRELDRLYGLSPHYRVHWFPAYGDQGAKWVVAEHCASQSYRRMGWYQLARFEQMNCATPANVYGALLVADGGHIVATFTEEQMWSPYFWRHLERLDADRDAHKQVLDASLKKRELMAVGKEASVNEAFLTECEDIAKDSWSYYMKGRHSVS